MISAARFPFFIAISIVLHLVWLSFDYHFPVVSLSQQISFGYISRAHEGFVPEKTTSGKMVVSPTRNVQFLEVVPQTKIQPREEHVIKRKLIISTPEVVLPKAPLIERTSANRVSSEVLSFTHVLVDLEAAAEPLLGDERFDNLELGTDGSVFPEKLISQDTDIDSAGGRTSAEGSDTHAGFQAALPCYALNPKPIYPAVARLRGLEGTVLFEVLVLESGRVGELRMVESSGYRSLDRAARKAIKGWVFKAATSFGVAVDSRVGVPINFGLDQGYP